MKRKPTEAAEAVARLNLSEVDCLLILGRYSLFPPMTKGDLLIEYPELRNVKTFVEVSIENPRKLVFVWFYASRASDAVRLTNDEDRILYALHAAWGKGRIPKEIKEQYMKRAWGEQVERAIADMRSFQPARVRIKLLVAQCLERVQRFMEEDMTAMTPKEKKEAFQAMESGIDLMQKLMPLVEHAAMGVVKQEGTQVEYGEGEMMERLQRMIAQGSG